MRRERTEPLLQHAARQHGLLTRADLGAAGLTRAELRTLVRNGTFEPLGCRLLRVAGSPATDHQRAAAAALDAGGRLSRRSMAWLHGIPTFELGDPPEVVVPGGRISYRGSLAVVHTTSFLPAADLLVVDGIPGLSVARTLFSLAAVARELGDDRLRGAVDDAVRLGKASDRWLWWRLEQLRRPGRDGVAAMEAVLVRRAGGHVTESWLERAFVEVMVEHAVPVPTCQARIARRGAFVARVDFAYDGLPLVIEVLGFTHHSSERQLAADADRRNRLQLEGKAVLEFVYDDIVLRPGQVARTVLAARRALLSDQAA